MSIYACLIYIDDILVQILDLKYSEINLNKFSEDN